MKYVYKAILNNQVIAVGGSYKECSDKAFELYPFEAGECSSYYITHSMEN